nr:MAG TPA: hypothetical protein [Caudoviricetes sp.]DAY40688.1 MAG TPA: hypothetical protein [Caudoviricetes sp.]
MQQDGAFSKQDKREATCFSFFYCKHGESTL